MLPDDSCLISCSWLHRGILCVKALSTCQWRIKGRGLAVYPPPPLFLDQTEFQGLKKIFFETRSPLISGSGCSAPPPPPLNRRSGSATECNAFSTELTKNSAYPRDKAPFYWWYGSSSHAWRDLREGHRPLNPISPKGDQHQFSPNNIHTFSGDKVMRITEMITKEKLLRSFIKFSQLPL